MQHRRTIGAALGIGIGIGLIGVPSFWLGRYSGSGERTFSAHDPRPQETASEPSKPLSVAALRRDMLIYNGKQVVVRALIVDFGSQAILKSTYEAASFGPKAVDANINMEIWEKARNSSAGWMIADDLGSYFDQSTFAETSSHGGSVLLTPPVLSVRYRDYVQVTGTYDANSNTLQATSVVPIGHMAPVAASADPATASAIPAAEANTVYR